MDDHRLNSTCSDPDAKSHEETSSVLDRANFDASEVLALEMNYSVHDGTDVTAQCGVCVFWQCKGYSWLYASVRVVSPTGMRVCLPTTGINQKLDKRSFLHSPVRSAMYARRCSIR